MNTLLPRAQHAGLVGRERELDRAGAALVGGSGVVFTGTEGVGRTAVARETVQRLDPRQSYVVWLTATEAGRQVPYGALAALLPASPTVEVTSVLPQVREALRARAGRRRPVLVVDDAHLLDGPSAAVLLALAGQVGLVVTVRTGAALPDAVTTLWKDGYLDRVVVEPVGEADTAALIASVVGGEVADPAVATLHQWTGGNPLYLTELVRAGLADGALNRRAGLWWWDAPLRVPPTLAELLDRRLDRLDPAARDALTAVAIGEPLAVDLLERVVAPDTVVRLEDEGLVQAVTVDGRLVLRFDHPLLGAAVRRRSSAARRRRLAGALLAARTPGPVRPADVVTTALWQLAAGREVDDDDLLAAADLVAHDDPALSLRFGVEAGRRRPSARAAVAQAAALVELGDAGRAREVLEKGAANAAEPADVVLVAAALAGHRAWAERDPEGGHRDLMAVLSRTRDPAARAELRSVDAMVCLFGARTDRALSAAESVLADPAADRRSLVRAQLSRATALTLTGRTRDGLDAARAVTADCAEDAAGLPYAQGMALAAAELAQIWRTPVQQVPGSHPQTGRWPTSAGGDLVAVQPTAWPLFDGYVRRVAGDLPAAIRSLRVARVQQSGGEGLFRSEATAWLALCLAESGEADEAEEILRATPPDDVAVVPGLAPWAAAAVAVARGRRADAADLMAVAVTAARRSGCHLVELGYLVYESGIRGPRGAAGTAVRLRQVLQHVDAPRLRAVAGAALAVVDGRGDDDSLQRHAERLRELNLSRRALDLAAADGGATPGDAARRTAGRMRTAHGGPAATAAPPRLTKREREVANLAAAGLTDRDIADRLVLSVRTVESHLGRVYRKLAIDSRRGLRAALHG